jgi:hypothetical protein
VRRVSPTGIINTIAGDGSPGYTGDGVPATEAGMNIPSGAALRADGGILIADPNDNRIRLVSPDGIISTVAGTGAAGFNGRPTGHRGAAQLPG